MKKKGLKAMAPRVPESAIEFYQQHWSSANGAAEWVLGSFPGMYHAALAEIRGRFSAGELSMLIDVANGSALLIYSGAGVVGSNLILSVDDSFRLYPGQFEEKWQIEWKPMMAKMESLTRFQLTALEVWAGSFWEGDHEDEDAIEKHISTLL